MAAAVAGPEVTSQLIPSSSNGSNAQQRNRNSLVELAKDYPEETAAFLERGLFMSAIAGLLVGAPCGVLLVLTWERCATCERPLRAWILVAGLLHLAQFPLRLRCYSWLSAGKKEAVAQAHEERQTMAPMIASAVTDVVQSYTWRSSQAVSCLSLGWLVIGIVWVSNCSPTLQCTEAYYATLAVLATAIVRLCFSVMSFRVTFSCEIDREPSEGTASLTVVEQMPESAAPSVDLDALPLLRCPSGQTTRASGTSCAICLGAFRRRQELRLLPCKHFFHKKCIDQWLTQRCVCPLCRSDDLAWATTGASARKPPPPPRLP
mmetsp:Transcript_84530/g.154237  ORF Transcript_84530/g.154237 Transcript_84530/m.154237 type:complete len:319 (+) Transcript_84530:143-1099(+)